MPPVPLTFFISLLHEISAIQPNGQKDTRAHPARDTLTRWIKALRERYDPLPKRSLLSFLRLLLPELDVRRKYHFQENSLVAAIASSLGVDKSLLESWKDDDRSMKTGNGCLGHNVKNVLERTCSFTESSLLLSEADDLLSELASKSAYSHASFRFNSDKSSAKSSRTRLDILKQLYRSLPPIDASFITQIILHDLRPILYPRHVSSSSSTALLNLPTYKTHVKHLTLADVLWAWDPSGVLAKFYHAQSSLEDISEYYESRQAISGPLAAPPVLGPSVGSPIEIPKCRKGQGCKQALSYFAASSKVWAETKYDGERCQIHVQIRPDGSPRITIYSKSQRDSTQDRFALHEIIRDVLHLNDDQGSTSNTQRKIQQNIVLEAEMVACHKDTGIDEFWRIRRLIEATAKGPRSWQCRKKQNAARQDSSDSEAGDPTSPHSRHSLRSSISDSDDRYLALVFFDVLFLDSSPLLMKPYSERRVILEQLIQTHLRASKRVMLAERKLIDFRRGPEFARAQLRSVFSKAIASFEEGLVLKAEESRYNCPRDPPWVKLKKDYIPGYGDCVDLVALGASWDKERGRVLNVPPGVWTTLHIGALTNPDEIKAKPDVKPHFHIYFCVSWGQTRAEIEDMNFRINYADPVKLDDKRALQTLGYQYDLFEGMPPPTVLFRDPLAAELYGGGFTKEPGSRHYYPRFPRITKLHRVSERSWRSASTLQELHVIARKAVGRDRFAKDIEDWGKDLFGKANLISPKVKSLTETAKREKEWLRKLELADGVEEEAITRTGTGWLQTRSNVRRKLNTDSMEETSVDPSSKDESSRVQSFPTPSPASESTPRQLDLSHLKSPLSPRTNRLPLEPPSAPTPSSGATKGRTRDEVAYKPPSRPLVHFALSPATNLSMFLTPVSSPAKARPRKNVEPAEDKPSSTPTPVPSQAADRTIHSSQVAASQEPTISQEQQTNDVPSEHTILVPPQLDVDSMSLPLLSALLSKSLVWTTVLEMRHNLVRPYKHYIRPSQRLHSLTAFLIGCGWTEVPKVPWAESGVIFVHSDTLETQVLDAFRAMKNPARGRRKVWLLGAGILEFAEISFGCDVEIKDYVLGVIE